MPARRSVFSDAGDDSGFSRPTREPEGELDITPMIDVTFLLLIFFMVTSTMKGTPDLDIPPADHGSNVDAGTTTVISIKKPDVAGGEPIIVLGADGKGPEATIEDVAGHVEQGLPEKTQVVISADREVPHGAVTEVARKVISVEGVQFFIEVRDKSR